MAKVKKLFIPIILGTVRKGRMSEYVAKYINRKARAHKAIQPILFDPRDMKLPMSDDGQVLKNRNPQYREAVIKADGFILVAPEYNHGYPGTLKRVLDLMLSEYVHKPVALCGVSAGGFGGTRVIEQLVNVVRELGLIVTFTDLNVSKVKTVFDTKGRLIDKKFEERIDRFLEELVWMSLTMRWGREHIKSKHHKCTPQCEHWEFI